MTKANEKDALQGGAQEFNAEFTGPLGATHRGCTDIIFLVLLMLFSVGVIAMGVVAGTSSASIGGYRRIMNGAQVDGKICGVDGPWGAGAEYKNVYFTDPSGVTASALNKQKLTGLQTALCVKECPDSGKKFKARILPPGVTASKAAEQEGVEREFSAAYDTDLVHNLCIPKDAKITGAQAFTRAAAELSTSGGLLAISGILSLVYASLFLVIMYYCGGFLVWFAVFGTLASVGAVGGLFWYLSTRVKAGEVDSKTGLGPYTESDLANFKIAGIVAWVIAAILVIVTLFLRSRIQLAIKIMKQATVAISQVKTMLLVPIVKFVMISLFLIYWIATAVTYGSAGEMKPMSEDNQTKVINYLSVPVDTTGFVVSWDNSLYGMFFLHCFGLLWYAALFIAIGHFVMAAATSQWYFAPVENGEKKLNGPVGTGFMWAFRYHIGTLAFGSFLVAVFETIRIIVEYFSRKAEKQSKNNSAVKAITCMLRCCACMMERCIKYCTSQAYIFTAIFGAPLCAAASKFIQFAAANPARIAAVHGLGGIILFLGKVFIVACAAASSYGIMIYVDPWKSEVKTMYIPLLLVTVLSYFVASVFMQVYSSTMDTIIMCFIADEQMSKNGGGKMRADKSLQDAVDDKEANDFEKV